MTIPTRERYGPHMSVRLPLTVHAKVAELAALHGASPSDTLRALVAAGLERAGTGDAANP